MMGRKTALVKQQGKIVLHRTWLTKSGQLRKFVVVLNLLTIVIVLQVYPLCERINLYFHHSIIIGWRKKM